MVSQQYFDLKDDTGCIDFTAYRCTMCGEVIDPVILKNRVSARPDLLHGTKQRKFMERLRFGGPRRSGGELPSDGSEPSEEDAE